MRKNLVTDLRKFLFILFVILIPVASSVAGLYAGAISVGMMLGGKFVEWRSLGIPPGKAVRLLGLCDGHLCVETLLNEVYKFQNGNCSDPATSTCWAKVSASAEIEPLTPQLANPCLFTFQPPQPPEDVIQTIGAKYCTSGGDYFVSYALLEDGSVWLWANEVGDMASLAVIAVAFPCGAIAFVLGLLLSIVLIAQWLRLKTKQTA